MKKDTTTKDDELRPEYTLKNLRVRKKGPGRKGKAQTIIYDGRIELIPLQSLKQMRGFLKGIDTTVIREKDRV